MKRTNELFLKQMTRKEFLQFVALAILGVLGFRNFVNFLLEAQGRQRQPAQTLSDAPTTHGFGASKFGA